jgi:hypothetical protein
MDATQILVMVLGGSVTLTLTAVWAIIIYYSIRKWRRRKTDTDTGTPPIIYGAWQGHMLGTTTLDPSDVAEIEKDLKTAAQYSEKHSIKLLVTFSIYLF